jgi:hypothetical protein
MQITVRNHPLLRLFGFKPISPKAHAMASMSVRLWIECVWRRLTTMPNNHLPNVASAEIDALMSAKPFPTHGVIGALVERELDLVIRSTVPADEDAFHDLCMPMVTVKQPNPPALDQAINRVASQLARKRD